VYSSKLTLPPTSTTTQEDESSSEEKASTTDDEAGSSTSTANMQVVECTEEGCESQMIRVAVATKGGVMIVTHALKKDNLNVKITRMTFEHTDGKKASALRVFNRK
jgi:hypothetical protein